MNAKCILLVFMVLLISCKGKYNWDNFKECIKSVPEVMSYPMEIESIGEWSHHSIGKYQKANQEKYEWNSHVYFGGRYEIVLIIDVQLNSTHSKVTEVLSEPRFRLYVYKNIEEEGRLSEYEEDIEFSLKEWQDMLRHKDNFEKMLEVLKVQYNSKPLELFEKMVNLTRPTKSQQIRLSE